MSSPIVAKKLTIYSDKRARLDYLDADGKPAHKVVTVNHPWLQAVVQRHFLCDVTTLKHGACLWLDDGIVKRNFDGRFEKRGRKPVGKRPMSDAERAAAYRKRKAEKEGKE